MKKNQVEMLDVSKKLLNAFKGEEIDLDSEFRKKQYMEEKQKALKEVASEDQAIKSGVSVEARVQN